MRIIASLFLAIAGLSGCASPPPAAFYAYEAAFRDTHAATVELLAGFEPFEREGEADIARRRPDFDRVYDPDEARHFAPGGRGALSQVIEQGFGAVATYNGVLALYASGASFSLVRPQLDTLGAQAAGLSALAGQPGVGAAVAAGVALAGEGLEAVAAVSDRARFAEAIKANKGKVAQFLLAAREATPAMFAAVSAGAQRRESAALRAGRDGYDAAAERAAFRAALDAWVLGLDDLGAATATLEAAVADGDGALSPEALAFWAGEARRNADEVRLAARAFAALR